MIFLAQPQLSEAACRRIEDVLFRLRGLFEEISPLIEGYTSEVCPNCEDVCCKQRHAYYDSEDLICISALGLAVPEYSERGLEARCEFLSFNGCSRPRWQRPFRCTWYFCEPLLRHMSDGPGRPHRRLVSLLQDIVELRGNLINSETVIGCK
ncbi:MAG: hypothetical protein VST71_12095 [Nitrospirota bacterium]|nr:hypothetical protein [Nitrospirota bacterium]